MAKLLLFTSASLDNKNHIKLLLLCTFFVYHEVASSPERLHSSLEKHLIQQQSQKDLESSGKLLSKRSVLLGTQGEDNENNDKHYSRFGSYLDKRYSFRSDLGKRSLLNDENDKDLATDNALMLNTIAEEDNRNEIANALLEKLALQRAEEYGNDEDDQLGFDKRAAFNADLGKRYSGFNSDLGKRNARLLQINEKMAAPDLLETIKRYGGMGFNADLGKRSSENVRYQPRLYRSDLGKRYSSFNSDLGKRSSNFRSDLGKRGGSSFRHDLGKRQYFRYDLGKRASFNADLGKRPSFPADLGKRPSFRAELGKRSIDAEH